MHKSVLLKEVIENLQIKDNNIFVDATLGNAGHTKAILESGVTNLTVIGIDADEIAIEKSREVLEPWQTNNQILLETTYFDSLDKILEKYQLNYIDRILFDLGFRSDQVDDPTRGFSFLNEGPLDMSFQSSVGSVSDLSKRENKLTASEIVNEWQEESLADIIYGFGGEGFSRRIAKAIVEAREKKAREEKGGKIETTTELAEIIKSAVPVFYRRAKIHPATKTFQALRIAVNSELERFKTALNIAYEKLSPTGRIAVISFHSLEDRITKRFFKEKAKAGEAKLIIKKPITATKKEITENPRARSAKLRIIEKL
ncbi:16S rRNA (cytosine(1402)-N(4))-methyltransferase RsmH [Candidatus Parcubacteria bacterium]|nr:16S rRNA (cytosine(1402)-N(4))-methyltransferase RsmH [Candidatus Parcubacteria bacterium]